ncbi:MAG: SAM-dependent chlorinase/fluorinase [Candidatus Kapabacteria bacterium]|nr:SAM-dependent chlorinase/fluorinase [Ignavibacteriota bacterium]MCW5885526.1 SAM-dependent chlorinase/fluorinase [Candidatus Kapabacteria bacterium]
MPHLSNTFSDAPEGALLAYIGSSGFLEIAVNSGIASDIIKEKKVRILL